MLRRLLLVMSVAALMAAMVALMAVPAFATIHPLANSECANESASAVARGQNPPGLSGGSNADNFAQPVFSASGGDPLSPVDEPPTPAFKTPGPNIAALDAEYCPANK